MNLRILKKQDGTETLQVKTSEVTTHLESGLAMNHKTHQTFTKDNWEDIPIVHEEQKRERREFTIVERGYRTINGTKYFMPDIEDRQHKIIREGERFKVIELHPHEFITDEEKVRKAFVDAYTRYSSPPDMIGHLLKALREG